MTDGQATEGVRTVADMAARMREAMAGVATNVFTFGFGADHEAALLRAIAEIGGGVYYYVNNDDDIALSGRCSE